MNIKNLFNVDNISAKKLYRIWQAVEHVDDASCNILRSRMSDDIKEYDVLMRTRDRVAMVIRLMRHDPLPYPDVRAIIISLTSKNVHISAMDEAFFNYVQHVCPEHAYDAMSLLLTHQQSEAFFHTIFQESNISDVHKNIQGMEMRHMSAFFLHIRAIIPPHLLFVLSDCFEQYIETHDVLSIDDERYYYLFDQKYPQLGIGTLINTQAILAKHPELHLWGSGISEEAMVSLMRPSPEAIEELTLH